MTELEMETTATKVDSGWRDKDGFIGPFQPGLGPRSDPRGEFPTGPNVGTNLPDVSCLNADGEVFNLSEHRGDHPAIFIFYRSAVW